MLTYSPSYRLHCGYEESTRSSQWPEQLEEAAEGLRMGFPWGVYLGCSVSIRKRNLDGLALLYLVSASKAPIFNTV